MSTKTGAGLCERCSWAREVRSRRGSSFVRCARSERERAYEKYPRLPVLACRGFTAESEPEEERSEER